MAEQRPDDFEKAIVSRARFVGRKLKPGLAYAISKNFVYWYSRFLAARFGERGARVVSISPGSFDTAMGRLEENHGASDLVKSAAIKRFGKPEEVAAVIAFCSKRSRRGAGGARSSRGPPRRRARSAPTALMTCFGAPVSFAIETCGVDGVVRPDPVLPLRHAVAPALQRHGVLVRGAVHARLAPRERGRGAA
jgi:hypothetical protein